MNNPTTDADAMPTVSLHPTNAAATAVQLRPSRAIDPDEEALRSVVRAIAHNCLYRGTTGVADVQSIVGQFRAKYAGLAVDLVRGAIFVLEAGLEERAAANDGAAVPLLCGAVAESATARKKRGRASDESRSSAEPEGKPATKWRKSTCKHEGCEKWAQRRGLCIGHGGTKEQCQFEDCREAAFPGQGLCAAHGGVQPRCAEDGCAAHVSRDGQKCKAHTNGGGGKSDGTGSGGKQRRTCRAEGCTSHRKRGGFCWRHGASRTCGRPNCPNQARREGVCGRHYCKEHGEKCARGGCDLVAALAEEAEMEVEEMEEPDVSAVVATAV